MLQDRNSGRKGDKTGRFIGQRVAEYLGITLNEGSNEGIYKNETIVIKSARFGNNRFGITKKMLERVKKVIVVKEVKQQGNFELYLVPIEAILSTGTDTKSRGKSNGKVKQFSVSKATAIGQKFNQIKIDISF